VVGTGALLPALDVAEADDGVDELDGVAEAGVVLATLELGAAVGDDDALLEAAVLETDVLDGAVVDADVLDAVADADVLDAVADAEVLGLVVGVLEITEPVEDPKAIGTVTSWLLAFSAARTKTEHFRATQSAA